MFDRSIWVVLLSVFVAVGCEGDGEEVSPDGEFEEGVSAGKTDGSDFTDCELSQVLVLVNNPATTSETLRSSGVHTLAARNIINYRDTVDENRTFDDILEVDDVSWVGPQAMKQLVAAVSGECEGRGNQAEVIFSPQAYDESHLPRVAQAIEEAEFSVDIAMYSFSDAGIMDAIENAISEGVTVRMIYQSANDDHNRPEGTRSAQLEDLGVSVRYVNKIMHHKYVIIDGPQSSLEQATTATLITGSANWSNSAGTRYDENTVIMQGNAELVLRFQLEYNHLWANSRDFVWNENLEFVTSMEFTEDAIIDDPSIDAVFTSDNFSVYESTRYGPTFSLISGESVVSDRLVDLIMGAQESIHIASGHLRSRPVSEALIARHQENPDLDIRVYLDNQEYISDYVHNEQVTELDECLADAATDSQQQSCLDTGFLFSYALHLEGIPVRFKYYCYRWHYSYAEQMHHKYLIIDGEILVSGSYNLSDNAEHNTMENIVIYQASAFPALVAAFEDNFETLWATNEEQGLYDSLLDEIVNGTGAEFPIIFTPMSIDWDQVTDLKRAIRDNCPDINSTEFRSAPQYHHTCERG